MTLVLAALTAHAGCGDSPTEPTPRRLALTCGSDVNTTAADGVSAQVEFDPPIASGGTPPVTSSCNPGSGAAFPVGDTVVRCTASDARRQSATCQFSVRVNRPPQLRRSRIIAFGDSITFGDLGRARPAMILGPTHSYPARLHGILTSRYTLDTIEVFNEGVGGETTSGGVVRLPGVLSAHNGDVLLLLEGVNGIRERSTSSQVTNLRSMVRTAKARGLNVLIATLTPVSNAREARFPGTRAAIVALNGGIVSMAAAEGINPVVDLYTTMSSQPELIGPDGLHPSTAGYAFMAEMFDEELQRRFETTARLRSSTAGKPLD